MVRLGYNLQASQLDPKDRASRTALKALTRDRTPAPMRGVIKTLRPDKGPKPGSLASANRTNLKWNMAGGGAAALGALSTALAVRDGLNEIERSSDKPRTAAGVAGSAVGGIGGGIGFSELGGGLGGLLGLLGGPAAEVTSPLGAAAGATLGGILGSSIGGSAGRKAGTELYDEVRRPK
jgi:hypothetical protein